MRELLLLGVWAAAALVQTGASGGFGAFTHSADIGAPPIHGSAAFDAATGQYRITGSGTDIWGAADQFHYVWREMSGDFAVTATPRFLTEGHAHRKAVIMLRKSLDADSPFVHLAIHGDGLTSVQFRNTKGGDTKTVDFPVEGPGAWTLKLSRRGTAVTVWMAKDGAPLRELGHTLNQLGSPILVGLGVSSHSREATSTVSFSDVSVEPLPPPVTAAPIAAPPANREREGEREREQPGGNLGLFAQAADVGHPARAGSAAFTPASGEYRVTGAGANIWGKQDQFQFVWRELTGDFAVTTTLRFLGEGGEHRKAGLMVRQSLAPDATYADVVVHGNGMVGLQWRSAPGEDTNAFDLPIEGPGTFTVKLVRTGVKIYMYVARSGAPLKEAAHTEVTLAGPLLVGLAVCSHNADASDTAVFSDVSITPQSAPAPKVD